MRATIVSQHPLRPASAAGVGSAAGLRVVSECAVPPDRWFDLGWGITRLGDKFLWLIRDRRHRIVARLCGFVATKSRVER
jgi:hypothetical protein